ncbi:hypothetical protein VTN31DRAFT_1090 [Thermomyces dupontii]|uniref:uncharacterized protein n=1 Tax=Talaromyces thermophilus TaxID=28565 RepID=UPI00374435B3
MSSLKFQEPYSKEELERLYPKELKLQLVQVFLRHGERTPVSARFQNTGLPTYWPYCAVARRMASMVATSEDVSKWDTLEWRRRIETFGHDDEAVATTGPAGEVDKICQFGELTDKGRETTFRLGQRLRHLYVDQLGFLPKIKSNAEDMYLRSSPIPRALESMQQAFLGMYPASARTADFTPPTIVVRSPADETVFPNDANCRRFRQLSRAFANRAAERWNNTEDMEYLNKLWSKWMPENKRVAVDSHPRLSGIMDTINATLAHGPATKLPSEFYDKKAREIVEKIAVDEWYGGYKENSEYRRLGIGPLLGDVVDRMVSTAVENGWRSNVVSSKPGSSVPIKFAMSGCHDTTLAAILASLGAYNEKWPPFTSSVAIELFSRADEPQSSPAPSNTTSNTSTSGILSFLKGSKAAPEKSSGSTARVPLSELDESAKQKLRKHYVRIRYNDEPVRIPGCAAKPENHLPGDESFCTLEAFKAIVDKFTPKQWKAECLQNLDEGLFGKNDEHKSIAGY